jgi:hypothetical protein
VEIKSASTSGQRLNEFTMSIEVTRAVEPTDKKAGKKG